MAKLYRCSASFLTFVIGFAAVAAAFGGERPPGIEFMDKMTENTTRYQNSRTMTVVFDDRLDALCPKVTSFVYSAGNRFELLTPNYNLMESATGVVINHNEEGKSDDITYQNRACRYIIAIKKFVLKDNMEVQLRLPQQSRVPDLLKRLIENQRLIEQEKAASRPVTEDEHAEDPVTIDGSKAIIQMNNHDLGKAGNTSTRTAFDTSDIRKEFTGIIYFGPKSFTVFIADAPTYRIDFHKDKANKSYEIEIVSSESRINLSLRKEVLANGWTTVFGD